MAKKVQGSGLLAGGLLGLAAWWVTRDFKGWVDLDQGVHDDTLAGYLHMTQLRLKMRDPFDLQDTRKRVGTRYDIQTLYALPPRPSKRPEVAPYPIPHRQLTQQPNEEFRKALQQLFDKTVADNSAMVRYMRSHFEQLIQAITCCLVDHVDPVQGSSNGEIAHIHPVDGSMHLVLSPSDAIVAIQAGWAQFHGLAGRDHGLPQTYVMVYGPQSEFELEVIGRLLNASIQYMCCAEKRI